MACFSFFVNSNRRIHAPRFPKDNPSRSICVCSLILPFSSTPICAIFTHARYISIIGLQDDFLLGKDAQQRFLPTRFTVNGHAIDVGGVVCRELACPHCHLPLPRALLEMEPLFISIIGAPSSGKSYFLASMTWQLRKTLSQSFSLSFQDADPVANLILNDYEEKLFLNPLEDQLTTLPKTEKEGGYLYEAVNFGGREVWYPKPFVFSIQPQESHPDFRLRSSTSRALCLYDNAGEHFLQGGETGKYPLQHLALSQVLMFLFDPLQHPKFRRACSKGSMDPQLVDGKAIHQQHQILLEAANRIRRHSNCSQNEKYPRPLVVVLTKQDAWKALMGRTSLGTNLPIRRVTEAMSVLDMEKLTRISQQMRAILVKYAPEIVGAAEGFCEEVTYIPASALGRHPEMDPHTAALGICPRDVRPQWAEIPMLYALHKAARGLVRVKPAVAVAVKSSPTSKSKSSDEQRGKPDEPSTPRIWKETGT